MPWLCIKHLPRKNDSGYGGVGLVYRENISVKLKKVRLSHLVSFENMVVTLTSGCVTVKMAIIYRPPPSEKNGFTTGEFFEQFAELTDVLSASKGKILLLGYLNFHLDDPHDRDADRLKDLLFSCGLVQHVVGPTHRNGHTLDVIITRETEDFVQEVTDRTPLISDHSSVLSKLDIVPPVSVSQEITYRKIADIDLGKWKAAVQSTFSTLPDVLSCDELLSLYNTKLKNLLDIHAPVVRKTLTIKTFSPWISDDIHREICRRRTFERLWRRTGLSVHRQMYK